MRFVVLYVTDLGEYKALFKCTTLIGPWILKVTVYVRSCLAFPDLFP